LEGGAGKGKGQKRDVVRREALPKQNITTTPLHDYIYTPPYVYFNTASTQRLNNDRRK